MSLTCCVRACVCVCVCVLARFLLLIGIHESDMLCACSYVCVLYCRLLKLLTDLSPMPLVLSLLGWGEDRAVIDNKPPTQPTADTQQPASVARPQSAAQAGVMHGSRAVQGPTVPQSGISPAARAGAHVQQGGALYMGTLPPPYAPGVQPAHQAAVAPSSHTAGSSRTHSPHSDGTSPSAGNALGPNAATATAHQPHISGHSATSTGNAPSTHNVSVVRPSAFATATAVPRVPELLTPTPYVRTGAAPPAAGPQSAHQAHLVPPLGVKQAPGVYSDWASMPTVPVGGSPFGTGVPTPTTTTMPHAPPSMACPPVHVLQNSANITHGALSPGAGGIERALDGAGLGDVVGGSGGVLRHRGSSTGQRTISPWGGGAEVVLSRAGSDIGTGHARAAASSGSPGEAPGIQGVQMRLPEPQMTAAAGQTQGVLSGVQGVKPRLSQARSEPESIQKLLEAHGMGGSVAYVSLGAPLYAQGKATPPGDGHVGSSNDYARSSDVSCEEGLRSHGSHKAKTA